MVIYHLIFIFVLKVIKYLILVNISIYLRLDFNQNITIVSSTYKSLLGGNCLTNQNCQTSDAICLNNICTCPNSYFPIDDWNCLQDLGINEKYLYNFIIYFN
jgi:hypothetical protein